MKNGVGLYIHIPFCTRKCFYCDFYSVAGHDDVIGDYVDALVSEVKSRAGQVDGSDIATIFFGGGTPSLLSPQQISEILSATHCHLKISATAEISLEMNPESVTQENAAGYLDVGITRVSLGVQSLNDKNLRFLQRIHNADDAHTAYQKLRVAGFKNISVDMMSGMPGQTADDLVAELSNIASWQPEHISCYELTVEQGTGLGAAVANKSVTLDAEGDVLYETTQKFMTDAGYRQHEISSYARPGFECRHNIGYWQYRDYLGVGAAAHSLLAGVRYANVASIEKYIDHVCQTGCAISTSETLTDEQKQIERLMMGLRLRSGIRVDADTITADIEAQVDAKMLEIVDGRLRATTRGFRLLNSVLAEL